MRMDGQWDSAFEILCTSIIYSVRITRITNVKGGFVISDTLRSLNAYQIPNDIITTSDRNVYLHCHTYKAHTTPSSQYTRLNHFAYLQIISHFPTNSRRRSYSGNYHYHNIVTINQISSSRFFVNNYSNTISSYSQIVNSNQHTSIINSDVSSIKKNKTKLIAESNGLPFKKRNKPY